MPDHLEAATRAAEELGEHLHRGHSDGVGVGDLRKMQALLGTIRGALERLTTARGRAG